MKAFAPLAAVLVVGVLLAGCTGGGGGATVAPVVLERPALAPDKGAISGLLIDDIYRPIPNGLVLLQGAGLTATTDNEGQFQFIDVLPGSYVALATAAGHEAAPVNVDVVAGQYTDLELSARRLFSNDGTLITTEYSIFTACATSGVLVATVASCILDSDSYRPGLHMDNFTYSNITYLVSEVKLNQADNYVFVLRCSGGGSFGCGEYGYANVSTSDELSKGVYGKVVLKLHDNYMHTFASIPWNNTDPMDQLVFFMGQGGDQITPAAKPVGCALPPVNNPLNNKPAFCRDYYGAGARVAVQGRIIMSLFIGEPKVPIDEYHTMSAPV